MPPNDRFISSLFVFFFDNGDVSPDPAFCSEWLLLLSCSCLPKDDRGAGLAHTGRLGDRCPFFAVAGEFLSSSPNLDVGAAFGEGPGEPVSLPLSDPTSFMATWLKWWLALRSARISAFSTRSYISSAIAATYSFSSSDF